MNITVIWGNVFDLGICMRTQYAYFYEKYCVMNETDRGERSYEKMIKVLFSV